MKYRVLRNFLKGCSLTTALFIFQACYGTPQGYNADIEEETYQTDTLQTSASEIESADFCFRNRECRLCSHFRYA